MYLIYIIVYLSILTVTYSESANIDKNANIAHSLLRLLLPAGNLARALSVSLNTSSVTCRGDAPASYPGDFHAYGGPILYLVLQALAYSLSLSGGILDVETRDSKGMSISSKTKKPN